MKKIIVALFFCFVSYVIMAQDECKSIFAIQKEYVENNFVVPDSQKVAFWNIYNAYLQEEAEIHQEFRDHCKSLNINRGIAQFDIKSFDNETIKSYYKAYYDFKDELLHLYRSLFQHLMSVLTPKQYCEFLEVVTAFKSDIKNKKMHACPREK